MRLLGRRRFRLCRRSRARSRDRSRWMLAHRSRRRILLRRSRWWRFGRCRRIHTRRARHQFNLYGSKNGQVIRAIALVVSLIAMIIVACLARPAASQTGGTVNLLSSPATWPTTGAVSGTTALGLDPSAIFLNPAGLATQDDRALLVQHGLLPFDATWDFAGVGYPIPGLGAVGLGLARLGTSGIEGYDADNQPIGTYGYSETALAASVARRALGPVYAGITFKVLTQALGDVSAAAPAVDLGFLYRPTRFAGAQAGFTVENVVAGSLDLGGASPSIDRSFRFGLAGPEWRVGRAASLRGVADVARHGAEGTKARLALEVTRRGLGALRAGFDNGHPLFGVGIQYRRYGIDLALAQGEVASTKQLGVRVAWGEPVSEYEARRRVEYTKAAEDSLRARRASRVAQDRARAEEAERAGDYETALVLWEVLLRDLPGDATIAGRSEGARTAIAERAKRDLATAGARQLSRTLAERAREALVRGDVEEAAGLARALAEAGARPEGRGVDSLAILEREVAAARDLAADRAVTRADSLRRQGKLLAAVSEAALALRLRPGEPRATAVWNALEVTLGKGAAEASVLARRLEALTAVHQASLAFNEGRYSDAAQAVQRALAADPTSQEARAWRDRVNRRLATPKPEVDARVKQLYIKGMEAFTNGDYREALRSWEQILVLDPLNESARRNILEARERMKTETRR